MDFYDEEKNVDTYVQMAEGYDGSELVDVLKKHLAPGSTVLELGMGPGKDVALLAEAFAATGSDRSEVFLRRYRRDHPDADVLLLDAVTMETERRFDAIYFEQSVASPACRRTAEISTTAGGESKWKRTGVALLLVR